MSSTKEASGLHLQAAADHEAAAAHHHIAAKCHDQEKLNDAKDSAKSAMGCCKAANKSSESACNCSKK